MASWKGAAYAYDDGQLAGTFSHCVITGGYKSGFDLYFSLTREGNMNLVLAHSEPKKYRKINNLNCKDTLELSLVSS